MKSTGTRIGPEMVVCRGADHVEATMADQTVIMSISQSMYFALEGTGQRIWDCLAKPASIARIVERMVEEYDVEPTECERSVLAFVARLMESGLVRECAA